MSSYLFDYAAIPDRSLSADDFKAPLVASLSIFFSLFLGFDEAANLPVWSHACNCVSELTDFSATFLQRGK